MQEPEVPGPIWIGPTKCDEDRAGRERDVDHVWSVVKAQLEGKELHLSTHGIVTDALFLLREAMNCYQNGAYLAVCTSARSCIEALLDAATQLRTTDEMSTEEVRKLPQIAPKAVLVEKALEDNLLTESDVVIADRIWESGNFAAHIGQRLDRDRKAFFAATSEQENVEYDPKGWPRPKQSFAILSETAELVAKVMVRVKASTKS